MSCVLSDAVLETSVILINILKVFAEESCWQSRWKGNLVWGMFWGNLAHFGGNLVKKLPIHTVGLDEF